MENPVLFEVENSTAIITLNRPDRRNSFNEALLRELYNAIDKVADDTNIKVAILTGNGKSFSSGIDLTALATDNLFDPRNDGRDLTDVMGACKKPIIGAVNGHAITGGFELALNCDFLIASENASFADTHARVGIHPGWGMTQLLQQAVGIRMAKQMSLSCQFISAQEALGAGLVNEVVPAEELLPRTKKIAEEICAGNPDMLPVVKQLIEFRTETTHSDAYSHERKRFREFVMKHIKK
ncbi:MAG: enoyl-CoA hydratase [bacterium]|nr:enoyl-CoA hydratase [bacterium]